MRNKLPNDNYDGRPLPNIVTFPYSRHSSYPELCSFVKLFRPRDIWPCTVDLPLWLRKGLSHCEPVVKHWLTLLGITIERLFSACCSGDNFRHDNLVRGRFGDRGNKEADDTGSQATLPSVISFDNLSQTSVNGPVPTIPSSSLTPVGGDCQVSSVLDPGPGLDALDGNQMSQHQDAEMHEPIDETASLGEFDPTSLQDSQDSACSESALETRLHAFQAMLQTANGGFGGEIGLLSTTDNHSKEEAEFTRTELLL